MTFIPYNVHQVPHLVDILHFHLQRYPPKPSYCGQPPSWPQCSPPNSHFRGQLPLKPLTSPPKRTLRGEPPLKTPTSPPKRTFRGELPTETPTSPPNRTFRGECNGSGSREREQFIQDRGVKFQNSTKVIIGSVIFSMKFTCKLNFLVWSQHTQFARETLLSTIRSHSIHLFISQKDSILQF